MAPSGNINPAGVSMFEPVHGSAPPLAGKNIANPVGAIRSAAMMLAHLGLNDFARRIDDAVLASIRDQRCTVDIGGALGTREAGDAIAFRLK